MICFQYFCLFPIFTNQLLSLNYLLGFNFFYLFESFTLLLFFLFNFFLNLIDFKWQELFHFKTRHFSLLISLLEVKINLANQSRRLFFSKLFQVHFVLVFENLEHLFWFSQPKNFFSLKFPQVILTCQHLLGKHSY